MSNRAVLIACLALLALGLGGWGAQSAHGAEANPIVLHYSPTACNCETPTPDYTDTPLPTVPSQPTIPAPPTDTITPTSRPPDTVTPTSAPSVTPSPTHRSSRSSSSSQPTATLTLGAPTLVMGLPETGGDFTPR